MTNNKENSKGYSFLSVVFILRWLKSCPSVGGSHENVSFRSLATANIIDQLFQLLLPQAHCYVGFEAMFLTGCSLSQWLSGTERLGQVHSWETWSLLLVNFDLRLPKGLAKISLELQGILCVHQTCCLLPSSPLACRCPTNSSLGIRLALQSAGSPSLAHFCFHFLSQMFPLINVLHI